MTQQPDNSKQDRPRHRRSVRMVGYDYHAPGAYFVTICAYERESLFEDALLYSLIETKWSALPSRFPTITLDEFIIMPNHIHGIIWLRLPTTGEGIPVPMLGDVVCTFKSLVAVEYIRWVKANDPNRSARVWQRNYYDHVIREETELTKVRDYIRSNPIRWLEKRDNLDALVVRMRERHTAQ